MDCESNSDEFAEWLGQCDLVADTYCEPGVNCDHYTHTGCERGEHAVFKSNPNNFVNAIVQRFAFRYCHRDTNWYCQLRCDSDSNELSI